MNLTTIRDALVDNLNTFWSAAHPTITMYYENAEPVDKSQLPDVFGYVALDFQTASQINVSPTPHTRYAGSLEFMFYNRETRGVRELLVLMDELSAHFGYKVISGVHLGVPGVGDARVVPGWYGKTLSIPFYADSNV